MEFFPLLEKIRQECPLFVLSFTFSFIFLILTPFRPFPGSWFIKWLSIITLALVVSRFSFSNQWILVFAITFHSIGDVLFELDREKNLVLGIAFFLLGHLFYIILFLLSAPNLNAQIRKRWYVLIPLAIYVEVMLFVLIIHLEWSLVAPVVIYAHMLGLMVFASFLLGPKASWVQIGALFYLFSDSVIAFSAFVLTFIYEPYLTWPTYYFGQLLIITGFLLFKEENLQT